MVSKLIKVKSPVQAWEKLNELLGILGDEVLENGGRIRGNQSFLYFVRIEISHIKVKPDFDFGLLCGYTSYKWTSLVNNYLDFKAMEELKVEVQEYIKTNKEYYSTFMNFINTSKQGHSCLMSYSVVKGGMKEEPYVIVQARATEATKRFLMDLTMIQRITEYIFGTNRVKVFFHTHYAFVTPECFIMYHNHKDIKELIKNAPEQKTEESIKWKAQLIKTFDDLMAVDESTVKYKVMRRAVRQIQKGEDGKPISNRKPLLAKTLKIFKKIVIKKHIISKEVIMEPVGSKKTKKDLIGVSNNTKKQAR